MSLRQKNRQLECSIHFTIVLIYQMWSLRSYAFKLKIVLYWEDDIYVDMCVYRFILKTVHLMKSTNKCNRFDTNG